MTMSMDNRPKDTAGWLLITAGILSLAILLMCGCSRKTMAATVSLDTLTAATESAANSASVSDRTADSDTYADNRADIADTFAAGTDTETQTAAASTTGTTVRPDTGPGDGWRRHLLMATVIAVVAAVVCVMIRKLVKK